MNLEAHGIGVRIPQGWEARLFRHPGGEPTLHAGSFPLPPSDGEFGSRATASMPVGATFLALTEYRPGAGLQAGEGLFAPALVPSRLTHGDLHPRTLLVARAGHEGLQRFFTVSGRPFCLYVVLNRGLGATVAADGHLRAVNGLLGSLAVKPAHASA
jgi:hypothetical protein